MRETQLHCPICYSDEITPIMDIEEAPVHCNLLCRTRSAAIEAPRAALRLGFCTACTHIFNYAFQPDLVQYSPDYENALDCSPRFEQYITELAGQLVDRHRLFGKHIIEIGCGNGKFLQLLCGLADATGLGFDPSYRDLADGGVDPKRITYIRDLYG